MKYRTHLIVLIGALFFAHIVTPATAQPTLQQQKDSLRRALDHTEGIDKLNTCTRLCYLYMAEVSDDAKMDTLLTLFKQTEEEAIRQGNVKMQGMVYGNLIISYVNRSEADKVIEKAPAYLDFYIRHDLWRFYYQIHMQLVSAYNFKSDYEQSAAEAKKMYDRAKEREDKAGMATALYASGITYNLQKRWKEEESSFRECIRLLWETSGYDNILTQAYAFLCMSLRAQQRYDEVLQLVPQYEKAIVRFEKAAGRTQPEARGNLYLALMNTYIDLRDYDQAEAYLSRLDGLISTAISQFELARARALIRKAHGDYRGALAAADSAIGYAHETRFNRNAAMKIKMEILARMGRNDEAFLLLDNIIALGDSIKDVEVNTRFDELRTQYEVEKHIAEKERNFHYFLFALSACLLLALLLAGIFYYNRLIAAKNRKLYERIKEQDRLTEELSRREQTDSPAIPTLQTTDAATDETTDAAPDEAPAAPLTGTTEQHRLLSQLRTYLLTDNNLLNAENNRDDIISMLGTNKNILHEAVRATTGKSPMEYIRTLKIEEARKMIENNPELSLDEIACHCGFNTSSTFYRSFKKQYGFSPSEYRKLARSSKG